MTKKLRPSLKHIRSLEECAAEMLSKDKMTSFLRNHWVLIVILILGALVWIAVFALGASAFLSSGSQPYRAAWTGFGEFDLFGLTVFYEFEGWADYDFYYITWSEQFLSGLTPYTDAFNESNYAGVDYYTPFFLPPLFLYLCVLGYMMGPTGPGALISLLGFVTVFPVYTIATHLSNNTRVGEIAAITYLFNPLVLYHTTYQWLNPAPFVFFTVLSYALFMKKRRTAGLLAMTTAVFFKQIALFFVLPLIAYLIKKPPQEPNGDDSPRDEKGRLVSDSLDLKGFGKAIAIVLVYAVFLSLPYILDFRNYLYYLAERPGAVLYDSVTSLPDPSEPITFTVLLIVIGAPEWFSQIFNLGIYYTLFLLPGILSALGLGLFEEKDDANLKGYWRRIFFYALISVFWLHTFSPRGIYKYYCVAIVPFISILASSRMISKEPGRIKASLSMLVTPFLISLVILFPGRYIYISILALVMIAYLLHNGFAIIYSLIGERLHRIFRRNPNVTEMP